MRTSAAIIVGNLPAVSSSLATSLLTLPHLAHNLPSRTQLLVRGGSKSHIYECWDQTHGGWGNRARVPASTGTVTQGRCIRIGEFRGTGGGVKSNEQGFCERSARDLLVIAIAVASLLTTPHLKLNRPQQVPGHLLYSYYSLTLKCFAHIHRLTNATVPIVATPHGPTSLNLLLLGDTTKFQGSGGRARAI